MGVEHLCHFRQRNAVSRRQLHRQCRHCRQTRETPGGTADVFLARHTQASGRYVLVALLHRLDHVIDRQPEAGQPALIRNHLDLAHQPAPNLGRSHALDAQETLGENVVGPGAQLNSVAQRRAHDKLHHRDLRRIELEEIGWIRGNRQETLGAIQTRGRITQGNVDVLAVAELQIDRGATLAGHRLHADGILGNRQLFLDLARDFVLHDGRRHARIEHAHTDVRIDKMR